MRRLPSLPRVVLGGLAVLALAHCEPATPGPEPRTGPPPAILPQPAEPPPLQLPAEAPPLGRLPADTRPTKYRLELRVEPMRARFEGSVDISVELDRLRDVLWLHGRDLSVTRAFVQPEGFAPIPARWEQLSKSGVVALRPQTAVGPGRVTVHVEYAADFGHGEEGLYATERGGQRYAYTQFEAIYARRAFPCFDEPAFKTPYEVILHVPRGSAAVANGREVSRTAETLPAAAEPRSGVPAAEIPFDRVAFAVTEKLPSYLVALAVGPLDVVDGPSVPPNAVRSRPLPLRGVTTHGRGPELSYALAHAGAIVSALEGYFGIPYPYEKLDLLAVPDKGGAMENAGAITFAETLLLFDEKTAPVDQRARFALVVAHELAHQWFGDLVTMPWWDDLWLNEAFASWVETPIVAGLDPAMHPEERALVGVHGAMDLDSLVSARKIRQEIKGDDDIENAFDGITYQKGAAVIGMFERWMGPKVFQKGIHAYLEGHRFGNATAVDLLTSLSEAAGRDVATPFRTFLDQQGLPFVEATLACDGQPRLLLEQARFRPAGASGEDRTGWQIPVCARYPDGHETREACTLLTEHKGTLPLASAACPAWVMPNVDAAGYYRWSLPPVETKKLVARGFKGLDPLERQSFAQSLKAGFVRAKLPAGEALELLAPFAADADSAVAAAPIELLTTLGGWLAGDAVRPALDAYGRALYAPAFRSLGWAPAKGAMEPPDRALLRKEVIGFLALVVGDPAVRREAVLRGRATLGMGGDAGALPVDLAGVAIAVAVQEGDAAVFDAVVARLATEQRPLERRLLLAALGSALRPELAARARELSLDTHVGLRPRELLLALQVQLGQPETRDAAWDWFKAHLDALFARMPESFSSRLMGLPTRFCDKAHERELEQLVTPRLGTIPGGPRALAGALEDMSLCVARRDVQEPSARAFFAKKKR